MVGMICLLWIGVKLNAPFWYYLVVGMGAGMGLIDSVKQVSLNREIKDHLNRKEEP